MEKPARVLVADDEPNAVILLRRIMEREGFEVVDVRDGPSALKTATEQDFDLILLDVMMPGLDGFEVIERLRQHEHKARVPVILITARAKEPTDVERGLGIGADDYVRKPFNPRELAARARSKIRAYHLEENLKRRTAELEALVRIGGELNESLEVDALLQHVLGALVREIPAQNGVLLLYHEDQSLKKWRFLVEPPDAPALAQEMASAFADLAGDGWINDEATQNRCFGLPRCASVLWTSLRHHGGTLGTLCVFSEAPNTYTEDHLRLIRSIGEAAALAIRNAELYEQLRGYADHLEEMVEARTAELRAAQESLIRSEKLASLGRLSASIAHEVNNPLQAVRNCLEMAIEDLEGARPIDKEMLQVAESHVRRIRDITTRLLSFARYDSDAWGEVDLNAITTEVLTLTRKQIERANVKLETDLNPLPCITASADQLKQVVLNLILNALEAMPNGGTLRVSSMVKGDYAVLAFSDTGVGISEEDMKRLFEPFFSTKRDGTGLGLSVSYGIIDAHQGSIDVDSTVGQGTTFSISLPLNRAETPASASHKA